MKKAISLFKQFGGLRLVVTYCHMGLFWTCAKSLLTCIFCHRPLKWAYDGVVIPKVEKVLIRQYKHIITDNASKKSINGSNAFGSIPKIVWSCWLQGLSNAPDMIKTCVASQRHALPDYEFRYLTLENYRQWIELPEYIEKKMRKGIMPMALFSDLLRLALLKKYGGIWIDATVLFTGFENEQLLERWHRIEQSQFFIFRYYQPHAKMPTGLSNWFIAVRPNHPLISTVLDMLLAYWKDYDCTVDYFIMHLFISLMFKAYPDIPKNMPKENSRHTFMLERMAARPYNEDWWNEVKAHVFAHKMNRRKIDKYSKNPSSYYNVVFRQQRELLENRH